MQNFRDPASGRAVAKRHGADLPAFESPSARLLSG